MGDQGRKNGLSSSLDRDLRNSYLEELDSLAPSPLANAYGRISGTVDSVRAGAGNLLNKYTLPGILNDPKRKEEAERYAKLRPKNFLQRMELAFSRFSPHKKNIIEKYEDQLESDEAIKRRQEIDQRIIKSIENLDLEDIIERPSLGGALRDVLTGRASIFNPYASEDTHPSDAYSDDHSYKMQKESARKAHSQAEMAYIAMHRPEMFNEVDESDKIRLLPKEERKPTTSKRQETKKASASLFKMAGNNFGLMPFLEHDLEEGAMTGYNNDERYGKEEVYYRQGHGERQCQHCTYYKNKSCVKVEGEIDPDSVCRMFESTEDEDQDEIGAHQKKASMAKLAMVAAQPGADCSSCQHRGTAQHTGLCKISQQRPQHQKRCGGFECDLQKIAGMRRMQGALQTRALIKAASSSANSVGANLATLLDGEIEENKMLREEIAKLRGSMEAGGGMASIPESPPPGSTLSPVQQIQASEQGAGAGDMQPMPPMGQGPVGMNGMPPGMPAGPNPGMGGMDPTGQMDPNMGPAPMSGQPTPGQPPGGMIDPNTGMPAPIDPSTGMPMMVDPMTGQQMPMDPMSGQIIDPATGQPPPPPPTPQEQQLQIALQQSQAELEKLDRENRKLQDENRALHHAIDPDEMTDRAKKMYDRAGTLPAGKQEIPLEGAPRKALHEDMLQMLIGQTPDDLATFGPDPNAIG